MPQFDPIRPSLLVSISPRFNTLSKCNYVSRPYTPGGYSHVKAYGDVPPKWVTFSTKFLRHGSHFGQKNP